MVSLPAASIFHSHVPDCVQPGVREVSAGAVAVGSAADAAAAEDAVDAEGAGAEGAEGAAGVSTGSDAEGAASESAVASVARVVANGSRVMGGGSARKPLRRLVWAQAPAPAWLTGKRLWPFDRKEFVFSYSFPPLSVIDAHTTSYSIQRSGAYFAPRSKIGTRVSICTRFCATSPVAFSHDRPFCGMLAER